MKNKEFYASQIVELAFNECYIAIDKRNGIPCDCESIGCEYCLLYGDEDECKYNIKLVEWGEQEHEK